ncbi:MAG: hypothetical protein ACRDVP_00520 [Acidimicrobiales bacterium]
MQERIARIVTELAIDQALVVRAPLRQPVRPDHPGAGYQVIFYLEYDRSTETLERLEKKLKNHDGLQVASGHAYRVCFGHPCREAGASSVLAHAQPSRWQ